jgi:hypothetical protein
LFHRPKISSSESTIFVVAAAEGVMHLHLIPFSPEPSVSALLPANHFGIHDSLMTSRPMMTTSMTT